MRLYKAAFFYLRFGYLILEFYIVINYNIILYYININITRRRIWKNRRYEKTRKFIENWANENINNNMPDDEGNDCSMYETLLDIFREAFTNYSDSDLYSWEALDDYAFERAVSYYSFATAKVYYEFADGAYDGYISNNTYR